MTAQERLQNTQSSTVLRTLVVETLRAVDVCFVLQSLRFFPEAGSATADKGTDTSDTSSYFGVAVSVVLALVLIVNVVVVVWLWRRQWTLPCAGNVPCRYILVAYLRMPQCLMLNDTIKHCFVLEIH